ncbi:MAG: abortive infection family protein [Thermoflexales bacterium]|nr:abortive infection family protein [Thermoflexales bacterium]
MADLSFIEKTKLEKLLRMGSGYVLDFSNRTFAEFVAESTGRNIYDTKYDYASGSKANRLRAFWNQEPNHVVGKLLSDLLEYYRETFYYQQAAGDIEHARLFEECQRIAARLLESVSIEVIEAITPEGDDQNFEVLARSVRESIENNQPEAGLDRLHTYVTKLVRTFAQKRGISVERDKPLHSIFGEYVKALRKAGLIESEMTERILKSSISIMEAFNRVRNERTLAHDNPLLNYEESFFIFNHIVGTIRFIKALEARAEKASLSYETLDEEIPF